MRCGRCKAYMNTFMRWTDGGKSFVCNFCGAASPCPEVYFNYLGPDQRCVCVCHCMRCAGGGMAVAAAALNAATGWRLRAPLHAACAGGATCMSAPS
jgi:hypothetical protein